MMISDIVGFDRTLLSQSNLLSVVLFIASVIVSLYAQELRRFLREWPRSRKMVRRYHWNVSTNKVKELQYLHENTYGLQIYLFSKILTAFVYAMVLDFCNILMSLAITHKLPDHSAFPSLLTGIIFGTSMSILRVLRDLSDYEYAVARLRRRALRNMDPEFLPSSPGKQE